MTSTTATSGGPAATEPGTRPPGRRRRCAAVLIDLASAALAVVASGVLALLWLLVRTGWGREDAASGDTLVATALVLAAFPAWVAWQLDRARRGAGTAGQASLSLAVDASARVRGESAALRLAWHPLASIAWLWLAAVAVMLGLRPVALACVAAAAVWALAGLVSVALVLRDPAARTLHDRLAGTRLVRR